MTFPGLRLALEGRSKTSSVVAVLTLGALTWATFRGGVTHEFTNWDDWKYILENPLVQGLSLERIVEAFSGFYFSNYNPLHLVSYMIDHELWGQWAGGYFITSACLHAASGILVYGLACRVLDNRSFALLIAALFLVHPTRVESVGWLSERKDVLSGFFAALALYVHARAATDRWSQALVLLLYLLALLSKSQLVTLPFLLLALDLWARRPFWQSLKTKTPHFALSAVFGSLTLLAHGGESAHGFDFPGSLLRPLAALPRYLLTLLWPFGLSPYYEPDAAAFVAPVAVIAGLGIAVTLAATAWISWQRERLWFLGIFWFGALLAPVLGFVRTNILVADRYLYLAMIGPLLAVAATLSRCGCRRLGLTVGVALVCVCASASASYLAVFSSSESLWQRVLQVCPGASIAHSNYGSWLRAQGRLEEAAREYDLDLVTKPRFEESYLGRASIHALVGEDTLAVQLYETLLEKRPQSVGGRTEYAEFLDQRGQPEEALKVFAGLDPPLRTAEYLCKLADVLAKVERRQSSTLRPCEAEKQ